MIKINLNEIDLHFTDDEIKAFLTKLGYEFHVKNVEINRTYFGDEPMIFTDDVELALASGFDETDVDIHYDIKTVFKKHLKSKLKHLNFEIKNLILK